MTNDIIYIFIWWLTIFSIGIAVFPLTNYLFKSFIDRGYIFAKVLGILLVSYLTFIAGLTRLIPFTSLTVAVITILLATLIYWGVRKYKLKVPIKDSLNIFVLEELLFLATLIFWSYIRAHQPNINGLEKFMDYGFVNSIIRSTYFPPLDMWFTPLPINYYYFGHLTTAVLTKLSTIPTTISYNLMIATLFAFTFTASFSLVLNLFKTHKEKIKQSAFIAAFLAAFLTSMGGNLHMIYSLFTPYNTDKPVPFWQAFTDQKQIGVDSTHAPVKYAPSTYPNSYWYPNATRFIPFTIHEFPLYSFVVSDLHGHVLDIPFVFLTLALLLSFIKQNDAPRTTIGLLALVLAVMYMTNAWDGFIYGLLSGIVLLFVTLRAPPQETDSQKKSSLKKHVITVYSSFKERLDVKSLAVKGIILAIGFIIFVLPFSLNFNPTQIVSGIGVVCAPEFLTEIQSTSTKPGVPQNGKLGPFLFEKDHCQKTPLWQLTILYGFFYFFVAAFVVYFLKSRTKHDHSQVYVLILIGMATFLLLIPEFLYVKDIYPDHYRANTMFKLSYQAFMMLSLVSAYTAIKILTSTRNFLWYFTVILLCSIVLIYPFFAIQSYYENLKTYKGLDGTKYLATQRPTDYEAILWIQENIQNQPVIVEAQGDSYTDYARISSNTGLPTVLGWTVHEWLWRGTYDIPAPRIEEVRQLYEEGDLKKTKALLKKHNVTYVYIGDLEREKYPGINEKKFEKIGKVVYKNTGVKIYKVTVL
jgi:uncharacterized membrane protein